MEGDTTTVLRVCIAGAGFAGAILAKQLQQSRGVEVTVFERATELGDSETGTGLNLNPNGMAALKSIDPELEASMRACGLARAHMTASTFTGTSLYRVPIHDPAATNNLATTQGLRIRWRDASTVIRSACPNITFGKRVVGYQEENVDGKGTMLVNVQDVISGVTSTIGGFDLVVACDGRYSCLRKQALGEPHMEMAGVCNFRVLIDDTSNGLFDDMELIYNETPSMECLSEELQADPELRHVFNGFPRIGIMKMPRSPTSETESLYIFGNFPVRDQIPESAKTAEVLTALYTPSNGGLSAKAAYIINAIQNNAHRLHWARMQEIPFAFRDESGRLLLLGDAAHAMVPTLGQGATATIEDACIAADEIIRAIDNSIASGEKIHVPSVTAEIEARASPRVRLISSVSRIATQHLLSGMNTLENDVQDWTSDEPQRNDSVPFRRLIQQVWCNYPRSQLSLNTSPSP